MRWLEHRIPPPAVALAVAALMWGIDKLLPAPRFTFSGMVATALAIGIAGILVSLMGVVEFRRARTTVNPMNPEAASTLVSSGIFRFTRNPMYLGFAIVLVGFGILLGNPLSVVLVLCFVAYMNRFQIGP